MRQPLSLPENQSQPQPTTSKEVERSTELRPSRPLPEPHQSDPGPEIEQTEERPTPSMIWAVNRVIERSRNINREINKAETIVIVFKWHPSQKDPVPHITFSSRNLADDHTNSYHGHRPGEQDSYNAFFEWMKDWPHQDETPSEEAIMRMPPALYEQWQNSGEAFGPWMNDKKFIGPKPKSVSMRIPIALFNYWHQNGNQADNQENIAGLYRLYEDLLANPSDSRMLRPVVKPLAKLGDNPGAYTPGAYGLRMQAVNKDPCIEPRTDRVGSAVEEDDRTPRAKFLADRAVSASGIQRPAVPSRSTDGPSISSPQSHRSVGQAPNNQASGPQFLAVPDNESKIYRPGRFGRWKPKE
ncbi:hypothetical protein EG328_004446 [Venturia inaequalis]|uniref:Uncharacterized protein n=1 Tax=Venturia inaequalis TaxID=5025 RepID=A0A8H3UY82_VENIN|nr:hypothetical protein EG328_004446 [Venturia inaequalis]KAE9977647.1 hypothetical protein EG327_007663 [Venturia inaequalis]RDI85642.1 hypothetical protein Vi05172_g4417 [Venturia inaequalis]